VGRAVVEKVKVVRVKLGALEAVRMLQGAVARQGKNLA
jgi:hypothetical protein